MVRLANFLIPFDSDNLLRSLSSGLTATENDNINCDDAESVGKNIHVGLDNVSVENAKNQVIKFK